MSGLGCLGSLALLLGGMVAGVAYCGSNDVVAGVLIGCIAGGALLGGSVIALEGQGWSRWLWGSVTAVALGVGVAFATLLGNLEHCPLFAAAWRPSG